MTEGPIKSTSFMNMKQYISKMDYRDRNLAFIDLEMTGLDLSKHEILEIACVLVDSRTLKIVKERVWNIKPKKIDAADPQSLALINYEKIDDEVERIEIEQALIEFIEFAKEATLIGFNTAFDWSFLFRDLEKYHIQPVVDYHILDIQILAYLHFQNRTQPKRLSLRAVARKLKISVPDIHGALADSRATYEIFKILSQKA